MDFTIQDELNLREAPKDTGNAYFMKGFTSHLGIKRYSYFAIFMPTFLCYRNGSPVFVFVLWNRGHDRFPFCHSLVSD